MQQVGRFACICDIGSYLDIFRSWHACTIYNADAGRICAVLGKKIDDPLGSEFAWKTPHLRNTHPWNLNNRLDHVVALEFLLAWVKLIVRRRRWRSVPRPDPPGCFLKISRTHVVISLAMCKEDHLLKFNSSSRESLARKGRLYWSGSSPVYTLKLLQKSNFQCSTTKPDNIGHLNI